MSIKDFEYFSTEIWRGFIKESPKRLRRLARWQFKKDHDWQYRIHGGPEYALYVALGTGIYGMHRTPIVPKQAKALRFEIDGKVFFRKSVKGQRPNPYHERAIEQGERRIDEFVRRAIREVSE